MKNLLIIFLFICFISCKSSDSNLLENKEQKTSLKAADILEDESILDTKTTTSKNINNNLSDSNLNNQDFDSESLNVDELNSEEVSVVEEDIETDKDLNTASSRDYEEFDYVVKNSSKISKEKISTLNAKEISKYKDSLNSIRKKIDKFPKQDQRKFYEVLSNFNKNLKANPRF